MNYRVNRAQLVDLVKRYKLESTTRQNLIYPDELIIRHLEQAQVRVVRSLEHEVFKKTVTVSIADGWQTVMPDDLLQDLVAWWKVGTTWKSLQITNANALDEAEADWRDKSGQPKGLVIIHEWDPATERFNRILRVHPGDGGDLRLRYTMEPPPLTSDSSVPLVSQLVAGFDETLLPFGAMSTLPLAEGGAEDERAQMFGGLFLAELGQFRAALQSVYNPGVKHGR